ncbi:MAG TPA: lysylphosphatidylglycerol synthase transmembrane domain-containing protein [bacterium]|nr:lysylphosphatidylglycerol synthase transmembrane domain-containing protein [bacterium]
MPEDTKNIPFKIEWKKLTFPFLIFLVVVVVIFKFSELQEIGRLFGQAKWYWLLAALGCQVANFLLQTMVYKVSFKLLNFNPFHFWRLLKTCITVIFLNYTVPSLGVAGNVWLLKQIRHKNLPEGKALMIVFIELICYYSAFLLLLLLSLVYLFFKLGHIGETQKIAVAGFFVALSVLASCLYFFLGNKKSSKKRLFWLAEKIDKAEDGVRQEDRINKLVDDFYQDLKWLKVNKLKLVWPFCLQLTKFLTDGANIYLIFLAFGSWTPIGLGLVAFAFGRLFGILSFIPGGLGAFEGSMVVIFNSLGVTLELSLATMLLYRLFSYWLYIPLGIVFYKSLEHD